MTRRISSQPSPWPTRQCGGKPAPAARKSAAKSSEHVFRTSRWRTPVRVLGCNFVQPAHDQRKRTGPRNADHVDRYHVFEKVFFLAEEVVWIEQRGKMPVEPVIQRQEALDQRRRFFVAVVLDIEARPESPYRICCTLYHVA